MKTILRRRAASGFVKYPKSFPKRIIDGTARFRTKCDVLVGPCACGGVHQESDDWVRDMLEGHNATFEALVLAPDDNGQIEMPRYWLRPRGHEDCNMLSGVCRCGKTHTVNEAWIRNLLTEHETKIVGCPEVDAETISETPVDPSIEPEGVVPGCPCECCEDIRRQRSHNGRRNRLSRGEI